MTGASTRSNYTSRLYGFVVFSFFQSIFVLNPCLYIHTLEDFPNPRISPRVNNIPLSKIMNQHTIHCCVESLSLHAEAATR